MPTTSFAVRYGPWALVLGASEGIGAAFSRRLAARGLDLLLVARRAGPLEALADELRAAHGVEVECASIDLAAPDLPARLEEAVAGRDVGLLVYNACYSVIAPFLGEGLWDELRGTGVDVLVCAAGATATPNFRRETPEDKQRGTFPMDPDAVAGEALDALGHGPTHVAGPINRLVHGALRMLPRRGAVRFFSQTTKKIYE